MTSKQFIRALKNLKEQCIGRNCDDCIFGVQLYNEDLGQDDYCQISLLVDELCKVPSSWDMDTIERIINK